MADSPVLKAIAVLRRLAERGEPVGVQQLASDTGLNVSTALRLLQLMVQDGMVATTPRPPLQRRHRVDPLRHPGPGLGSLTDRVRPIVADLARHLGETCALTLYEPRTFTQVFAIVERGPHPLGYDSPSARATASMAAPAQADPGLPAGRGDRALPGQLLASLPSAHSSTPTSCAARSASRKRATPPRAASASPAPPPASAPPCSAPTAR